VRSGARTVYGVHAGLQRTTVDELRAPWRRIEELGFGWMALRAPFDTDALERFAAALGLS